MVVIFMAQQITPELENKIREWQNIRQQVEVFRNQLAVRQQELNEIQLTLEELKKHPDDVTTYKAVGNVMFQVDKANITSDLEDRKVTLESLIKSVRTKLEKQEAKDKELENQIQIELSKRNLTLQ